MALRIGKVGPPSIHGIKWRYFMHLPLMAGAIILLVQSARAGVVVDSCGKISLDRDALGWSGNIRCETHEGLYQQGGNDQRLIYQDAERLMWLDPDYERPLSAWLEERLGFRPLSTQPYDLIGDYGVDRWNPSPEVKFPFFHCVAFHYYTWEEVRGDEPPRATLHGLYCRRDAAEISQAELKLIFQAIGHPYND